MSAPLVLEVSDLHVAFGDARQSAPAVRGVSLQLRRGEVLGIVGESGSGKSVTGLAILGLLRPPGFISKGSVRLFGEELVGRAPAEMRGLRGRKLAMVFQDPMTTLNPVLRIDTQIIETIRAHEKVSLRAARDRAISAIARVGIPSPEARLASYPHQLSGGMRQRIAIAIALLHRPALLIADEPTTALDVTIQSQVLSEVQALTRESGTSMIWISHDLAVVAGLADRIAVMYAGQIVEEGSTDDVLDRPMHRYTGGLLGSIPGANEPGEMLAQIPGMAPSLQALPSGCAFAPRCSHQDHACRVAVPQLVPAFDRAHRCIHPIHLGEPV